MTARKPTEAQRIEDVRSEMRTRQKLLEQYISKIDSGNELTPEEQELARGHVRYINKHKEEVARFYRPAIVMAE